jgi:hypothetical protein
MYKKITHKIVEEHFRHIPKNGEYDPNGSLSINDPLPQYVMNENTLIFRMDARTAWAKWAYSLLNYSISLNGDLPGTDQVKGRVHKNAMVLGDFIVPYYGLTAGNLFATSLIALNDVGMHYVNAIKNNESTEEIVASWGPFIADVAKLMNELNPSNWPELLITEMFTNLVNAWQAQLTARATGDTVADEIAIDTINKIVVTGIPDHHAVGYSSIADTFSRGIVAQFPSDFAE